MKKLLLLLLLSLWGCSNSSVYKDCDNPTMFVLVYGNYEETYPTSIQHLEKTMKYHKGDIRKIMYFCNDVQLRKYLDSKYPLIKLDYQVLQ